MLSPPRTTMGSMTSWATCGSGQHHHTRPLSRTCMSSGGHRGSTQLTALPITGPGSPPGWATLQIQPQTTSVSAVLQTQAGCQGSCKQPGGDKEKSPPGSLSFPGHVANSPIPSSGASASGKNFPFPVSHPCVAGASHQGRRGLSLLCFGEGAQRVEGGWEPGVSLTGQVLLTQGQTCKQLEQRALKGHLLSILKSILSFSLDDSGS